MNPKPKRDLQTFALSPTTERIRDFIKGLLANKPPPEAASDAGYAPSAWRRLIKRPDVVAALKSENHHRDRVLSHTPARVQDQLGNLAFSDALDYFYPDGTLRPLDTIPPEARAAIVSLSTSTYTDADGRTSVRNQKLVVERKQPALETLAEITGLTRDERVMQEVAQQFKITIHLGPESVAIGQQRNAAAYQAKPVETDAKPLLETTELPSPTDEKGN